ncbi:MAG TPA: hypothetical protein VFF82_02710 [Rhodocyclaceae bacterium]|nr:hypothetical protein [Rhodocyclaceae bacterium]
MARIVFLLFILANLVFFVWAEGYLGGGNEGREPERLNAQLQSERLRVTAQAESPAPAVAAPAPVAAALPITVCRRVGPMAAADADKLKKALTEKGGVAVPVAVEETSYWVYIPAGAGKGTENPAAELKHAGINDFFVVDKDGPTRGALSLGLFYKEDAAKDFLQRLNKKGIKSAKIAPQPRKSEKVILDVRGESELLNKQLTGQAVEAIDCPKE